MILSDKWVVELYEIRENESDEKMMMNLKY